MTSWRRLWLQIGDPAFAADSRQMRRELAQVWAVMNALEHLEQDAQVIEMVARQIHRQVCELAVRSLGEPATFDDGYWQEAWTRVRAVETATPDVARPQPSRLLDVTGASTPVSLMAEILPRVAPERSLLATPVMATGGEASLQVERSRPGWRLTGSAEAVSQVAGSTHLAVFAVDEGDNEVLAFVPVDMAGVMISSLAPDRDLVAIRFVDVELTDDDVVLGRHERAVLADRITVAALAGILGSATRQGESASDPSLRWEIAMAHAAMSAALAVIDEVEVTRRSRAVSAAVTIVVPVGDRIADRSLGGRFPVTWHLDRLIALL